MNLRLQVQGVSKNFGEALVLDNVGLSVRAGSLHALVGSNGSGKSTLVKIITGVHSAEPGAVMLVNGKEIHATYSTKAASDLGIRAVHQDAPLVDYLSVAEMFGLFQGYPRRLGLIGWRELRRRSSSTLERLGIEISTDALAKSLQPAERALIALALALADVKDEGQATIILDEATASLPVEDATKFLRMVQRMANRGAGALVVTHRLREVIEFCDSVTVLNGGVVVYEGETEGMAERDLVLLMIGGDKGVAGEQRDYSGALARVSNTTVVHSRDDEFAAAENLSGRIVKDVSFSIGYGEILGLTGLVGSGASEIGRLLAGVDTATGGNFRINGTPILTNGKWKTSRLGTVAYLPSDRLAESGIPVLTLADNIVLPRLGEYWGRKKKLIGDVTDVLNLFDVKPKDPEALFGTLSGGNQQKALLGKWLLTNPSLLILDDPTAGIDPATREIIFDVLRDLARRSVAILLISSESDQLAKICSRVLIVRLGQIAIELSGKQVTEEEVALASSS